MSLKNLNSQVENVLEHYEEARNSDIVLTKLVWKLYYNVRQTQSGKDYILLDDLFELPNQDNIKRIRAHIQNDLFKYLPTSLEVAKKRKWSEESWRSILGYNTHPIVPPVAKEQQKAISWLKED